MEIERRKHLDRVSYSTGLTSVAGSARGSSLSPPHTTAAAESSYTPPHASYNTPSSSASVSSRLQELTAQTDRDAVQIQALREERDALLLSLSLKTNETTSTSAHTQPENTTIATTTTNNNNHDNTKLQTQLAALLKQRDLLLTRYLSVPIQPLTPNPEPYPQHNPNTVI